MSFQINLKSKQVGAIFLAIIIIGSSTIVLLTGSDEIDINDFLSDLENTNQDYKAGFGAEIEFERASIYKGENLPFILKINVLESISHIHHIIVNITDGNRIAGQRLNINQTLDVGTYILNLELAISFNLYSFMALNYGDYTINGFVVFYRQRQIDIQFIGEIDNNISVTNWPEYEQMENSEWEIDNVDTTTNFEYGSPTKIIITPDPIEGSASLWTNITTTGYTNVFYNVTGLVNSEFQISLDGTQISGLANQSRLDIGRIFGYHNLSITVNITDSETITISISMITQHIPIFVVSANNHWNGWATDRLTFEYPDYYIRQVSRRFVNVFNISFMEVVRVDFETSTKTNLFDLINDANREVGKALWLENNTWNIGPGPQAGNAGIDIELVFTNKTMDHLGIVIGAYGEAFNIAVNARGSIFSGNYRLPSSFADNLLQHEISHIFGAPDRWTSEDDGFSIMTKSAPEDAWLDVILGRFWLFRTDWLEQDIQVMKEKSIIFL